MCIKDPLTVSIVYHKIIYVKIIEVIKEKVGIEYSKVMIRFK